MTPSYQNSIHSVTGRLSVMNGGFLKKINRNLRERIAVSRIELKSQF